MLPRECWTLAPTGTIHLKADSHARIVFQTNLPLSVVISYVLTILKDRDVNSDKTSDSRANHLDREALPHAVDHPRCECSEGDCGMLSKAQSIHEFDNLGKQSSMMEESCTWPWWLQCSNNQSHAESSMVHRQRLYCSFVSNKETIPSSIDLDFDQATSIIPSTSNFFAIDFRNIHREIGASL